MTQTRFAPLDGRGQTPTGWKTNRLETLIFSLTTALALLFALYTRHAWEDWFIAFRSAKNLATGHGLVYTVAQRVHSFTSPVGVLIPALLSCLTGSRNDDSVLWLFRLLNAPLLGWTGVMLVRIARSERVPRFSILMLAVLFALDNKTVDFSTNGMETAYLVAGVAAVIYFHLFPTKRAWVGIGAAWAVLQWTRPDGFVYSGALALGFLLFRGATPLAPTRRALVPIYFRSLGLALLLYAPWVAGAWAYYGSPVPHSVIAKGLHLVPTSSSAASGNGSPYASLSKSSSHILYPPLRAFAPAYYKSGQWRDLPRIYLLPLLVGLVWWLVPWATPMGRVASLAFGLSQLYMCCVVPFAFPWYQPPITLLGFLTFTLAVSDARARLGSADSLSPRARRALVGAGAGALTLLVGVHGLLFFGLARQMFCVQRFIEDGNRRQIGLYLRAHAASPQDTVMLEPLGYIGFFSGLKMLDFPGIASPEMVAARRQLNTNDWGRLIPYLRPKWLVLRPLERGQVEKQAPGLLNRTYEQVRVFDVRPRISATRFIPNRRYLEFDSVFTLYRRRPAG